MATRKPSRSEEAHPDLPALAAKLDAIVPNLAWELTGSEDCLERLRQDAMRLLACPPDKP